MRLPWLLGAVSLLLLSAGSAAAVDCTPPASDEPRSYRQITTPLGTLRIRLLDRPGEAPNSVAHFLAYADAGDWENGFFHRMLPNGILEGGGYTFDPIDGYGVVAERAAVAGEPGICNAAGTLALAKPAPTTPTMTNAHWFINLEDHSASLGGPDGWTVFAQVVAEDMPLLAGFAALHREYGRLLIDDPIAMRGLEDETFSNVPVLESPPRPPEGWGCIGRIDPDPVLVTIPLIPYPIWITGIDDVDCQKNQALIDEALALMRADMGPKIDEQLVWMTVPEPIAGWGAGSALATLGLASWRRRRCDGRGDEP